MHCRQGRAFHRHTHTHMHAPTFTIQLSSSKKKHKRPRAREAEIYQREMIVKIQMESKQVLVFMKHLVSRDPSEFSSNSNMKCCFSDPEVSLRSGPTSKDPASSCPKLAPRAWMGTEGSRGLRKPESLVKIQGPGRRAHAWRDLQNFGVHLSV